MQQQRARLPAMSGSCEGLGKLETLWAEAGPIPAQAWSVSRTPEPPAALALVAWAE